MSNPSKWLDKPDADGLWWFQTCRGTFLMAVRDGKARDVLDATGMPLIYARAVELTHLEQAKWQRCELTRPEPYVPPKPPKVTQYTAVVKGGSKQRFLTRIGDAYAVHDLDGTRINNAACWEYVNQYYTDIKPLEEPCPS